MRASHFARGLPGGKRVRWSSFERWPNGLGALRISQNLVPSKVTSSFQKFITLHTTVRDHHFRARRHADVGDVDDVVRIVAYQGTGQRAILPEN